MCDCFLDFLLTQKTHLMDCSILSFLPLLPPPAFKSVFQLKMNFSILSLSRSLKLDNVADKGRSDYDFAEGTAVL